VPHAAAGDGAEGGGGVDGARARGAEHVRRRGDESGGVLRHAELRGHLDRPLRPVLDVQLGVDGVDGVLGGADQVDAAAVRGVEVADREVVARDLHRGVGLILVAQRRPVLEGGDQRERLERGTALGAVLGDGVAGLLHEVGAAVQRDDPPGVRVHGDQAHAVVLRPVLRQVVDGGDRGVLPRLLDGGHHREARRVQLRLLDAGVLHELGAHHVEEVSRGTGEGVRAGRFDGRGEGLGVTLILGDPLVLHHQVEHAVPPLFRRRPVHGRVVVGG